MFHLGPFWVTPRFRIYSLGVDTNVFYTAIDRRTDFIAHGGPGLEMVVPLHGALKLRADGTIGYLYFARTESQRRLTGAGLGRLAYEGVRLHHRRRSIPTPAPTAGSGTRWTGAWPRTSSRPRPTSATSSARGSRSASAPPRTRYDVDEDQEFFGADLRDQPESRHLPGRDASCPTLSLPRRRFIVEADYQADRFLLDAQRDTDSNRLGGGFAVDSTTLSLRPRDRPARASIRVPSLPDADRIVPYANVDLTYHFGPRTRLTADVPARRRVLRVLGRRRRSAHAHRRETYGVRLEKGLWRRLDLRLHAALTQLRQRRARAHRDADRRAATRPPRTTARARSGPTSATPSGPACASACPPSSPTGGPRSPTSGSRGSSSEGLSLSFPIDQPRLRRRHCNAMRCAHLTPLMVIGALVVSAAAQEYEVGPGDVLERHRPQPAGLDRRVHRGPRGVHGLPFVGRVKAAGLSAVEIERKLDHAALRRLPASARRSRSSVKQFRSHRVFVTGEAARPGPYGLRPDRMLSSLLQDIGDLTPQAGHEVVIIRPPGSRRRRRSRSSAIRPRASNGDRRLPSPSPTPPTPRPRIPARSRARRSSA